MIKNSLKKLILFCMVGAMSFSIIGCNSAEANKNNNANSSISSKAKDESNEEKNALDKVKEKEVLTVGLSADFAPYEFHKIIDGKDTIVGFDIEIAKEIAKDLGVELEIKDMEYNSLIGALAAEKIDVIISGLSPNEERDKTVDFSEIYYSATQGILVRAEDMDKYQTLESLEGKKIGAQMSSIQAELAEEQIPNADLKLLSDLNALILELKSGKIDALVIESLAGEMAAGSNPDLVIAKPEIKDTKTGSAVAVNEGEQELLDEINKTIARLLEEGLIDKFVKEAEDLAQEE